MKESWRYYAFLRRWGLILVLGLVLGALGGLGFDLRQDHRPIFKAKASVVITAKDRPGVWLDRGRFNVVSAEHSDAESAVRSIVSNTEWLDAQPDYIVTVEGITINTSHPSSLWKAMVLGGVFGVLLVIGAAYLWDDIRAYMRYRKETDSDDA
jgi:uncharacterized protein involved in exopolysaccharide biosynthesis